MRKKTLLRKFCKIEENCFLRRSLKKKNEKEKDFLQSPEENWDDIVNKEVLNVENEGKNIFDDQVYSNLSKLNKNFVFNSDSKTPINKNFDLENSKKVSFEPNFMNSSDSKFNKDQNYYKKLKNK